MLRFRHPTRPQNVSWYIGIAFECAVTPTDIISVLAVKIPVVRRLTCLSVAVFCSVPHVFSYTLTHTQHSSLIMQMANPGKQQQHVRMRALMCGFFTSVKTFQHTPRQRVPTECTRQFIAHSGGARRGVAICTGRARPSDNELLRNVRCSGPLIYFAYLVLPCLIARAAPSPPPPAAASA